MNVMYPIAWLLAWPFTIPAGLTLLALHDVYDWTREAIRDVSR